MAPEVINGICGDPKSDVWSAGVILYIMLIGNPPFTGKNRQEIIQSINRDITFSEKDWSIYPDEVIDLLRKMLTINPENRITALDALNHPWILDHNKNIAEIKISHEVLSQLGNFHVSTK